LLCTLYEVVPYTLGPTHAPVPQASVCASARLNSVSDEQPASDVTAIGASPVLERLASAGTVDEQRGDARLPPTVGGWI
jgi:hypothetical protein